MKKSRIAVIAVVVCSIVLAAFAVSGCAAQSNEDDPQVINRKYMSDVSRIVDDLSDRLENFSDAVSRDDLVGMKTQSENAGKSIAELENLEAPEELKDIKDEYVDGCNDLKKALSDYVALYTEVANATEEDPFDYSTYDSRLEKIQDLYNSGLEHLEKGDTLATEKS